MGFHKWMRLQSPHRENTLRALTRGLRWLGGAVAALTIALCLLALLAWYLEWDEFCCVHTDTDICSGMPREERYVLSVCVHSKTAATDFSKMVMEDIRPTAPPIWKRVNTHSFISPISPNYRYHGAISSCDMLAKVLALPGTDTKARRVYLSAALGYLKDAHIGGIERLARQALDAHAAPCAVQTHPGRN